MLSREFVLSFREAAPYINAFRGKTFVLAVNGETVAAGRVPGLAQDINLLASLGARIVLVHGARPQIEKLAAHSALKQTFHRARRVTDPATMDVVRQAVGATRYEIEAALSMSMPNSPMQGAHLRIGSGNFLTAQPLGVIDGVDMLYTGHVRKIDNYGIRHRLEAGELVLISSIGYSPTGEAFNLTMEEVATQTAIALRAEKLIFFIGGDSVITRGGEVVSTLDTGEVDAALSAGGLSEEATAYLPCAVRATREGVARVHLVSRDEDGALLTELFTDYGSGTMVARDPLVRIRTATIEDVGDLIGLIAPLEAQGILVKRSREALEMEIGQYSLLEHDGRICGCVAMHAFPESGMAELACLAVSAERRDAGFGEMMLQYVENQARRRGIQRLFVLTTQTAHWFVERGFVAAPLTELPMERQECYNFQRRSKVFIKTL
ncbi:amino-acid N-acetyltransferase [Crenobacter cavernae]|uniref:Amino-acid acetyltransferase n=1 Tax=Crenobacter cavernae TaxID=2290923 RepID=A0A345Y2V8_9NEIS|nr:amino-acid N-acetyltransferase [Crenobacter cavernae]AXK38260.1 amino-acid N-acetyltransferase [Crenobacter cavernae]